MPFERWLHVMKKPWIILLCIGMVVLSMGYVDRPMAYYFHAMNFGPWLPIIKGITLLGYNLFYLVFLLILALYFRYFSPHNACAFKTFFLWVCVAITSMICTVLKVVLGRARPELLFNDHLYGFYGFKTQHAFWSMPSGHTTTLMSLAFGLIVIFPKYRFVFLSIALLGAFTRVLLTDHYLSDVLVAGFISFYEIALITYWLKPQKGCLM